MQQLTQFHTRDIVPPAAHWAKPGFYELGGGGGGEGEWVCSFQNQMSQEHMLLAHGKKIFF